MIPVSKQLAPADFDARVAKKGKRFLSKNPNPKKWKNHNYWTAVLPDLWSVYSSVCAYCCHWIPLEQGSATVDHFLPKSVYPDLAYEWDNYRLASSKLNAKKGVATDVMDPFELKPFSFILLFPAMLVKPQPDLENDEKKRLWATIDRLGLNDDEALVQSRYKWVEAYSDGKISFNFLLEKAPFIASEIDRQNLHGSLSIMFSR
ncbi:MAG: hypothetical protein AAFY41_15090, partial [Bacteroidota bacterium]